MQLAEPKCSLRACRHFTGVVTDGPERAVVVCAAFPEGIPDDIAYGDNAHARPRAGQAGNYVYEKEK